MSAESVLIVEASRMIAMPLDTDPFPPRVLGNAIVVAKDEAVHQLQLRTNSYAASVTCDSILITAQYAAVQYANSVPIYL